MALKCQPFTPRFIVRRDLKITEGSTVSVNYVSGSSGDRIEKMFLSKRSVKTGSRVLIVDDFLKGGGTITGMISLLSEFDSELAGVGENMSLRRLAVVVAKDGFVQTYSQFVRGHTIHRPARPGPRRRTPRRPCTPAG